ncbi:MAG: zinc-ribbon domain-containing protein [Methanobacterium sp. ERen5]|nr:MAG: zinc-ribbon domain-containing protein [Methanobacterium sp. ERen5]
MICENCGAEIRNRENYCPNCGMEVISPYNKSIKARYMAGEYTEDQGNYYSRKKRSRSEEVYVEETEPQVLKETEPELVEEYYEPEPKEIEEEGGVSVLTVIILFLIVALLFGFVIGILIFSGFLHSLPGFSKL